jgi:hypothetical protein
MRQTSLSSSSACRYSTACRLRWGFSLLSAIVAGLALPAQAQTPPEGADKTFSVRSNSITSLTVADWGFTDTDLPPHTFSAVKITSLPAIGTLKVDGVDATVGQVVSVVQPSVAGVTWTARESKRNWSSITSSADGSKLAAVAWGQIYTSSDSGVTWTARESDRAWESITSSADGSKLAAVDGNERDGGQIYTSTNSGVTWTARGPKQFWRAITSSADGSKLAAIAYSYSMGGGGRIYTSTNSGVTWTARAGNRRWTSITSSADGSKLAAVASGERIYTSSDSGVTWTARESDRLWNSITSSADGSKLAAVVWGGQIYISSNSGETWTAQESDRDWISITSSANGSKIVAVEDSGDWHTIHTSTDSGVTWIPRASGRNWTGITSSADGNELAAVESGGQILTSIPQPPSVTYHAPEDSDKANFTFQVQDSASTDNFDLSSNTMAFEIANTPTVLEPTRSTISKTSAILGGRVGSDGGSTIIERGVVYSLTRVNENPMIGAVGVSKVEVTGTADIFSVAVTQLSAGSSYSFKAYATNGVGTTYTDVETFTTLATPPEGANKAFRVPSHSLTNLRNTDWGFADSDSPPHTFTAVRITSLPTLGTLKVDGVDIDMDQVVPVQLSEVGMIWKKRGSDRGWRSITSSADGSKLAAVVQGGQIYTSSDSGVTWAARESSRDWGSITSSADGSKLAAVVRGYPAGGRIYTSTNSGVTWTARETNRMWFAITCSADGTKLAAVDYGYPVGGRIYTSTNAGASWTARATNRTWSAITSSADGSKLAAVVWGGQIYTSTDFGVSWTERGSSQIWNSITSSADGSKLAAVSDGDVGGIYTSTDFGVTWTERGVGVSGDWESITSSADGSKLAAVRYGKVHRSSNFGVTWTASTVKAHHNGHSITSSADGSKLALVGNGTPIYTSAPAPAPSITYSAPPGTGTASFSFRVQDSASTDNEDLSSNTLTFDFDTDVPSVDGPLVRNSKTGLFEQNVTVTNNSIGVTMPGFRLILTNLPNGIDFPNKTHPFLPLFDSLADLAPGDSRVVKVSFKINDKNLLTWQPNYQMLSLDATQLDLVTNMSGIYAGLVQQSEDVHLSANPKLGGRIDMTMSTTGAVTGSITEGAAKFPFVTKLSLDPTSFTAPYFKVAVPKTDKALELIFDHPNAVFTGTLNHSTSPGFPGAEVNGLRKVWTTTRTAASYSGRHNFAISNPDPYSGPHVYGYGSYTITESTGNFVRSGKLADGSAILGSGFVGANGQVFVYQTLYANRGSVMGFQRILPGQSLINGNLSGELGWFKPAPASAKRTDLIYPDGFLTGLSCAGGYYTVPAKDQLVMKLWDQPKGTANGEIRFLRGGLETEGAEFQTPLHISSKNAFTPLAPNPEKMRITRFDVNTGLFTGSFIRPAQGTVPARTVTFEGQISYDEAAERELGHGFFLMPQIPVPPQKISTSPRLSGSVWIVPAGSP